MSIDKQTRVNTYWEWLRGGNVKPPLLDRIGLMGIGIAVDMLREQMFYRGLRRSLLNFNREPKKPRATQSSRRG